MENRKALEEGINGEWKRELSGPKVQNINYCKKSGAMALNDIKDVDIDPEGVFKYILIKVYNSEKGTGAAKSIVRGYKRCPYHADIYEEVEKKELVPKKLKSECLGGGRIQHQPTENKIKVYGYSQGFGKADHAVSVDLLKKAYPEYDITWSDEGY